MKYKKKGFDYTLLDETFAVPEEISPMNWEKVFGAHHPLTVEIGCGNGHFLTGEAASHPERHFIGIDLKDYRIIKSRMKEQTAGLANTRWICGEAFSALERMFADRSIQTIYMTFPDPWPKKRHHKHRLFKPAFLDLLFCKLEQGGRFIFITDHEEYFQWCQEILKEEKRFTIVTNEYHEDLTKSAFGMIWKEDNRTFYSFTLEKF